MFFLIVFFQFFLLISTTDLSFELKVTLFLAFISFIVGVLCLPMCFFKDKSQNQFIKIDYNDFYSIGFVCILSGVLSFFYLHYYNGWIAYF